MIHNSNHYLTVSALSSDYIKTSSMKKNNNFRIELSKVLLLTTYKRPIMIRGYTLSELNMMRNDEGESLPNLIKMENILMFRYQVRLKIFDTDCNKLNFYNTVIDEASCDLPYKNFNVVNSYTDADDVKKLANDFNYIVFTPIKSYLISIFEKLKYFNLNKIIPIKFGNSVNGYIYMYWSSRFSCKMVIFNMIHETIALTLSNFYSFLDNMIEFTNSLYFEKSDDLLLMINNLNSRYSGDKSNPSLANDNSLCRVQDVMQGMSGNCEYRFIKSSEFIV